MEHKDTKLSYSIDATSKATDLPRTRIYQAIASGDLVTFKVGRRRMVSARALADFIERMESAGAALAAA